MKKNCYNCKHFEHGSDELIYCKEYTEFDGSYCNKRPDETEDFIHIKSYQEKAKRCCEPQPQPITIKCLQCGGSLVGGGTKPYDICPQCGDKFYCSSSDRV